MKKVIFVQMLFYTEIFFIFVLESNQRCNGILKQHKFLTKLTEQLQGDCCSEVIKVMDEVRKNVTHPSNLVLYFAGNLDVLKSPVKSIIDQFTPPELKDLKLKKR